MSCHGYLVTKCWFPPVKNSLCKSCHLIKDKDTLNNILKAPYDKKRMEAYLYSSGHESMVTIKDTFDTIANYLYTHDKELLEKYIWSNKALFSKRVYTHNGTQLCPIVSYLLRKQPDVPMPGCCLMCLAHTLRYTDDDYIRNIIFRSVVIRYADLPTVESMVRATQQRAPLYEFGAAILEKQGHTGVFDEYMKLLYKLKPEFHDVASAIYAHPVFHKVILSINLDCEECQTNKRRIYNIFKDKKKVFFEELLAKSMHPSRVFQWCLDNEDSIEMEIPPYEFKEGKAEWDIPWS